MKAVFASSLSAVFALVCFASVITTPSRAALVLFHPIAIIYSLLYVTAVFLPIHAWLSKSGRVRYWHYLISGFVPLAVIVFIIGLPQRHGSPFDDLGMSIVFGLAGTVGAFVFRMIAVGKKSV